MGWEVTDWKTGKAAVLLDRETEESDLFCGRASGEAAANSRCMLAPFADSFAEGGQGFGCAGGRCEEAGSAAAAQSPAHVAATRWYL